MTTRVELARAYAEGRRDGAAGVRACPYDVRERGALVLAYVRGWTAATGPQSPAERRA